MVHENNRETKEKKIWSLVNGIEVMWAIASSATPQ